MRLGNDSRTLTLTQRHTYLRSAIGWYRYRTVPCQTQLSEVLGLSALVPPPQRMTPHMDPCKQGEL